MTQTISERNTRQREALHKSQGGLCHYCRDPIGTYVGDAGDPVLEHHTPRSKGGKRAHIVLACTPCDKRKGMMDGSEFSTLIATFRTSGPLTMGARIEIAKIAKARNLELQAQHGGFRQQNPPPRKIPKQSAMLVHPVFQESAAEFGCSGRDEFIRQWHERRAG